MNGKRYYIGVMIPLKTFNLELQKLIKLSEQYNLGSIMYDKKKRLIATNRVVVMYFSRRVSKNHTARRYFDAVFQFDEKHTKSVRPGTEVRNDSYLDYILKKEGYI